MAIDDCRPIRAWATSKVDPQSGKRYGDLMARETIVWLVDDLDSSEAVQTIQFGWDGVSYEIDLSAANADSFTQAMAPYVAAARRASPHRRAPRGATRRGSSPAHRERPATDLAAIRDWAGRNGYRVSSRGRIPTAVLDAYQAARGAAPSADTTAARPAKKIPAKKSPVKRTAAKKANARKAAAKKAAAKKAASRT